MNLLDLYAELSLETKQYEAALRTAEKDATKSSDNIDKTLDKNTKAMADALTRKTQAVSKELSKYVDDVATKSSKISDNASAKTQRMSDNLTTVARTVTYAITESINLLAKAATKPSEELDAAMKDVEADNVKINKSLTKIADSLTKAATKSADAVTEAIEAGNDKIKDAHVDMAANFDKQADKIEARARRMKSNLASSAATEPEQTVKLGSKTFTLSEYQQWKSTHRATGGGGINFADPNDPNLVQHNDFDWGELSSGLMGAGSMILSFGTSLLSQMMSITGTIVSVATNAVATVTSKVVEGTTSIITTIANIGVKSAEVAAGVVAAATAAATTVAKLSIDAYGEYEQLAGGIDTLFGENGTASKTIKSYAANAFKTVQMTANEYLQTVTDFSASLLQNMDADSAADKADQALRQIADNSNKMGTVMSSVSEAYKGFSKDNFTLLDNLKLGYGGTAGEMARLINDSGVLNGEMEATAENVKDIPFDKIIDAIGKIQDKLGMTGASAEEASSTIQGSIASLQAAYQNLLSGMSDPNADVGVLAENLMGAFDTAMGNVVPAISRTLKSVSKVITTSAPAIRDRITSLIKDVLPTIIDGGAAIAQAIGGVIIDVLPTTVELLLSKLADLLAQDNSKTIRAFVDMLMGIANTVATYAPQIITSWYSAIATIIDEVLSTIAENPTAFAQKLANIITAIGEGIVEVVETIAPYVPIITDAIIAVFTREDNLARFKALGSRFIDAIAMAFDIQGEEGGIDGGKLAQKLVDIIEWIGNFFADNIDSASGGIGTFISNFVTTLLSDENTETLKNAGKQILDALGLTEDNIKTVLTTVLGFARNWIKENEELIRTVFSEVGKLMFEGLAIGLEAAVYGAAEGAANGIAGGILDFLWGDAIGPGLSTTSNIAQYFGNHEQWIKDHPGATNPFEGAQMDMEAVTSGTSGQTNNTNNYYNPWGGGRPVAGISDNPAFGKTYITTQVELDGRIAGESDEVYQANEYDARGW